MARIQYSHRSSASTVSFSVRQLPNAPFVLSCPIRSFRKLNSRARKNRTPETQCSALFQKNFVLLTCRLILRFPQFLTFDDGFFLGGGGILFPFSKLRNFYHFINQLVRKVENFSGISRQSLIMKQTDKMAQSFIRFNC